MARIIRIIRTATPPAKEGEAAEARTYEYKIDIDERYDLGEQYEAEFTASDVAQAALDELQAEGCDHHYSASSGWEIEGWYCSEVGEAPHSRIKEMAEAFLEGFSREESYLVHAKLFGR